MYAVGMARLGVLLGRTGERRVLDGLLENARGGESAVLVMRGEAGVGKTALLRYCARQASGFRVAQVAGVEAEIEVYAGQHGWCITDMPQQGGAPIYNEADAERAWGKLIELYAAALS